MTYTKKPITSKQQTILNLIYVFRFINRLQIQLLLKHKDHRRINKWLKDLVTKEYLISEFKRLYGNQTKPTIYSLSKKGRDFVKKTYLLSNPKYFIKLSKDHTRSKSFKIRTQIIIDFYILVINKFVKDFVIFNNSTLINGVENNKSLFQQFYTPAFYKDLEITYLSKLMPDALYLSHDPTRFARYHIFILDAYLPKIYLYSKIKRIFELFDDIDWDSFKPQEFQLIFICPNKIVLYYLKVVIKKFIEDFYDYEKLAFQLLTRSDLYKLKINPDAKLKWVEINE